MQKNGGLCTRRFVVDRISNVEAQAAFFAAELALSAAPSALAAALSPICWPASETVSVTSVALFCDTSA